MYTVPSYALISKTARYYSAPVRYRTRANSATIASTTPIPLVVSRTRQHACCLACVSRTQRNAANAWQALCELPSARHTSRLEESIVAIRAHGYSALRLLHAPSSLIITADIAHQTLDISSTCNYSAFPAIRLAWLYHGGYWRLRHNIDSSAGLYATYT